MSCFQLIVPSYPFESARLNKFDYRHDFSFFFQAALLTDLIGRIIGHYVIALAYL